MEESKVVVVGPGNEGVLAALMAKGLSEEKSIQIVKEVPELTVAIIDQMNLIPPQERILHHPALGPIIHREFKSRGKGTNFTPKKKKRKK